MEIAKPDKVYCEECSEFVDFEDITDSANFETLLANMQGAADEIIDDPEYKSDFERWPARAKKCRQCGDEFLTFELPGSVYQGILESSVERRKRITDLKKTGHLYDSAVAEMERQRAQRKEDAKIAWEKPKLGLSTPSLDDALKAVVGDLNLTNRESVDRLFVYIKTHRLQDPTNNRMIHADDNLKAIFKQELISMYSLGQACTKLFPL